MIAVSKELKQACNSESLSYKEYIVIDNTTIEIKGKMSNTAYKNTTFFGTFNLKMLEFTTENDIDYKKKTFTYWKSVNGEAFKIGSYIVIDIKDNDSTEDVTITAMDYGLKFATPYTTSLNYASGTVTLYDVLQECCLNVGVELENSTIANGDFIVDGNQFVNGEQIGMVIANIAGICGDFATINENDKLELIFYKKTETIDSVNLITEDGFYLITEDGTYLIVDDIEGVDDYISLDDKRDTQPITCMSLGFSNIDGEEIIRKDNDLIALYGENWLRIDDNYFAYSTAKMNLLIDNIFNKVKGFGYSSFVTKYSFKPYLQLGDMIYFKNKNGAKIRSVIFKIDTDYDDITLSAPSITNATVEYERPDDALTIAKNAQISVDRANSRITLEVDAINTDVNAKLELKVDTEKLISEINASADEINLNGGSKINLSTAGKLVISAGNFQLDSNGNVICNNLNAINSTFSGDVTSSNVTITGGNISLLGENNQSRLKITNINDSNLWVSMSCSDINMHNGNNGHTAVLPNQISLYEGSLLSPTYSLNIDGSAVSLKSGGTTVIEMLASSGNIRCVSLTQTSLADSKKNFELYSNALEEIKAIDIYKYNFKNEKDTDKKHLGFVIGNEYNYSNLITSVDENNKENGVDVYAMASLCLQSIKELNDKISKLEIEVQNGK